LQDVSGGLSDNCDKTVYAERIFFNAISQTRKKQMKLSSKCALTSALIASLPVVQAAEDLPFEISVDATLVSDFVVRGLSYTDEGYAIQALFDIEHDSGFYGTLWSSNVKFLEAQTVKPEDRASIGVALYAGYRGEIGDVSYDANVNHVMFPGASSDLNYDYTEFHIDFSYTLQRIDLGLNYDYSPNYFFKTGDAHNYEFTVGHTFPNDFDITGSVGRQTIEDNAKMGIDDYMYYTLSFSYPIATFDLSIIYSNTDLDNAEAVDGDDRVYFTVTKSL
jgi:uncharacterized protein (TIGR02001 family)